MASTYARELAVRSYAALAFDFTGWGQSEETPRYVEDSATKTADIRIAAAFIVPLDEVDPARISGLGICVSSGYMAAAVADDDRFRRVALVAPWLHGPAMAEGIYGGADAVAGLIAASERRAPQKLYCWATPTPTPMRSWSGRPVTPRKTAV